MMTGVVPQPPLSLTRLSESRTTPASCVRGSEFESLLRDRLSSVTFFMAFPFHCSLIILLYGGMCSHLFKIYMYKHPED